MGRKKQEWSPWALPHIVEKMTQTQEKLIEFWEMAAQAGAVGQEEAAETIRVMQRGWDCVNDADLSWVDRKLCDIIAQTATTIPRWSPAAAQPAKKGFIAWEKPIFQVPMTGHIHYKTPNVSIDAIAWMDDPKHPDNINIAFFSRLTQHRDGLNPMRQSLNIPLHEMFNISLHRDTPCGAGVDADEVDTQILNEDVQNLVAVGADGQALAVVGATWLLMQQPSVATPSVVQTQTPRQRRDSAAAQKAAERKASRRPGVRVTTYDVTRRTTASNGGRRRGGGREYASQWWVRGHWRQQPWGPGRKLRRPVFIEAHLAGPSDKPVDDRPQVRRYTAGD